MSVPAISSHVVDALARVLEEYKTAPRLRSLITALAAAVQENENVFSSMRLARSIADATGVQLEEIGKIVGVERPDDVQDYVYRVIIFGKAAANSSAGETENVINTYRLLTLATDVRLEEVFPAKINIFSNGLIDDATSPYVEYYLKLALPAGVMLGTYGLFSVSGGFGFAENPAARGFGDLDDPTVGGGLGSLLG